MVDLGEGVMAVMVVMAMVATVSEEKVTEAAQGGACAWVEMAPLVAPRVVPRVAAYPVDCNGTD